MGSEMDRAAARAKVGGVGDVESGRVAARATDLASDFHFASVATVDGEMDTEKSAMRASLPMSSSNESSGFAAAYVALMPLPGISCGFSIFPADAGSCCWTQKATMALAMGWQLFSSTALSAASSSDFLFAWFTAAASSSS